MISSLPNILIVDDIEVNLILLETALRKEQAKIHKATSGEEALVITEKHEFALIILDVSMPGMNGFELAAAIRKQQLNVVTPIIFISAILFDEFSVSQGYRSGAVDYLSKPYHHEVLLSKVRVFLQLYNQKQELHNQSQTLRESNEKLKAAQEVLKLRLQLQKAASLASARFSGNFELINSIHFMLRDIANVCGSSSAIFLPSDKGNPIVYNEGAHSAEVKNELHELLKSTLKKDFNKNHETSILISIDIAGEWVLPYKKERSGNHVVNLAIRVASGEKHYGYILVHECAGLSSWEASELNALSVFGTVTGNALERDETRLELIASEIRYRSYIENAPEGIVITSASGVILEYNQAFEALFSEYFNTNEPINISDILKHQNVNGHYPIAKNLLNGKLSQTEFAVTMNNKNFIIKAQSVKLATKQYLIFCTDITNERELEKHIIQTERMVAIGEMATGLAHEINQPLNTISFGIDNLFEAITGNKADAAYVKEKSNKLFESIHRMRNIVDHVRNFARGNDDVILSSFSVEEPIENALSLFTEQLRNHGIEVRKHIEQNSGVHIHGNTYKIEQVLLNLLSNARDTMDDKKSQAGESYQPLISIKGILKADKFIVTVTDNGMGMTAEQLKQISKPFYTSKAPGKGTGLGLAISQKIIAEHKGTLTFSSKPHEGTTAHIELPLVRKEPSQSVNL